MMKKERNESIDLMATLEQGNNAENNMKKKKKKKKKHHHQNRHAIHRFGEDDNSTSNTNTDSAATASALQKANSENGAVFMKTGDQQYKTNSNDSFEVATWQQISRECCYHSSREWAIIALQLVAVSASLYFFLVGIELQGEAAKVMFGCKTGALFNDDANPLR
jgi:hypothetical protein